MGIEGDAVRAALANLGKPAELRAESLDPSELESLWGLLCAN
jgi:hypothetical protein